MEETFWGPAVVLYAAEKNVTVLSKNIQLFSYLTSDVEHASTLKSFKTT